MKTGRLLAVSEEGLDALTPERLRRRRKVLAYRRQAEHQLFLSSGWGQFVHAPRFHMVAKANLAADGMGSVTFACDLRGSFGWHANKRSHRATPLLLATVEADPDKICPDCRIVRSNFIFDLTKPEYAYFFGFSQADGHLSSMTRSRGLFSIELNVVDLSLLEAFRDLLPFPSYLSFRTRMSNFGIIFKSVTWRVHHRSFRALLIRAGLPVGKKSDLIKPPLLPYAAGDYFRGLIDADGSLGLTGRSLPFVSLVTSSDAIANAYKDYVFTIVGYRPLTNRNKRDGVYNIMVTKEKAQKMVAALYGNATLSLVRKQKKAEAVAGWVRPKSMRHRGWTLAEDAIVISYPESQAAEMLGRTLRSVTMRRYRLRAVGTTLAHVRKGAQILPAWH